MGGNVEEMKIARKRSFGDIALGFFLLTHPGPVALHLLAVLALALPASWPHLVWSTIILLVAAHAAMQCSIAMLNDHCDRRLDALSKPGKPIVQGFVLPHEALLGGVLMALLMVILLLFLNPLALLVSLCYLALGQAYNFGVKSTPWSGLVFALAIALIPLYVLAGVGRTSPAMFWIVPVGFVLGVALHLANSLPDIESDQAGNAKTLTVILGVKGAFIVCPLLLVVTAALTGALVGWGVVSAPSWFIIVLPGITCLAVAALLLFFGPRKPLQTRTIYFYLVALTCLVVGVGWCIALIS
jgi:4-hydroxybenzoate polyprenyltransferase